MGKVWEVIKDQKDLNLPAHKVSLRGHLHLPSGQDMCTSAPWVSCEQPPLQGTRHENVVSVSLGLWLHYWQQQLKLCSPACNFMARHMLPLTRQQCAAAQQNVSPTLHLPTKKAAGFVCWWRCRTLGALLSLSLTLDVPARHTVAALLRLKPTEETTVANIRCTAEHWPQDGCTSKACCCCTAQAHRDPCRSWWPISGAQRSWRISCSPSHRTRPGRA